MRDYWTQGFVSGSEFDESVTNAIVRDKSPSQVFDTS